MSDYWLRMGLVIYGLLLFLVIYRDYRRSEYNNDIEIAILFGALVSFTSSLVICTIYVLLNLFVGGNCEKCL